MHDRLINTLTKMASNLQANAIYLTYNPVTESWNAVTILLPGEVYCQLVDTSNIFSIKKQVREFVLANAPKMTCA